MTQFAKALDNFLLIEGISIAVAFEQRVGAHLSQVIAQLVQAVAFVGQAKARRFRRVKVGDVVFEADKYALAGR